MSRQHNDPALQYPSYFKDRRNESGPPDGATAHSAEKRRPSRDEVIRSLPQAMRKSGFPKAAELMQIWQDGAGHSHTCARIGEEGVCHELDWDWLLKWLPVKEAFDRASSVLAENSSLYKFPITTSQGDSPAPRLTEDRQKLKDELTKASSFTFVASDPPKKALWLDQHRFQYFSRGKVGKAIVAGISGRPVQKAVFTDLDATLGTWGMRIYLSGEACKDGNDAVIAAPRFHVWMRDSYDFNDKSSWWSQPLGGWSLKGMDENGYWLTNADFRSFDSRHKLPRDPNAKQERKRDYLVFAVPLALPVKLKEIRIWLPR